MQSENSAINFRKQNVLHSTFSQSYHFTDKNVQQLIEKLKAESAKQNTAADLSMPHL